MKMKMNNKRALASAITVMLAVVFVFSAVNLTAPDSEAADPVYDINLPKGYTYEYTPTFAEGNITVTVSMIIDGVAATNGSPVTLAENVTATLTDNTLVVKTTDAAEFTASPYEITLKATAQGGQEQSITINVSIVDPLKLELTIPDAITGSYSTPLPTPSEGDITAGIGYEWSLTAAGDAIAQPDGASISVKSGDGVQTLTFPASTVTATGDEATEEDNKVTFHLTLKVTQTDEPAKYYSYSPSIEVYSNLSEVNLSNLTYTALGETNDTYVPPTVPADLKGIFSEPTTVPGVTFNEDGTITGFADAATPIAGTSVTVTLSTGEGYAGPAQSPREFTVTVISEPDIDVGGNYDVVTYSGKGDVSVTLTYNEDVSGVTWSKTDAKEGVSFEQEDTINTNVLLVSDTAASGTYSFNAHTELGQDFPFTLTVINEAFSITPPEDTTITFPLSGASTSLAYTQAGSIQKVDRWYIGLNDSELNDGTITIEGGTVTVESTAAAGDYKVVLVSTSGQEQSADLKIQTATMDGYEFAEYEKKNIFEVVSGTTATSTAFVFKLDDVAVTGEPATAVVWSIDVTNISTTVVDNEDGTFTVPGDDGDITVTDNEDGTFTVSGSTYSDEFTVTMTAVYDGATVSQTVTCQVYSKLMFTNDPYNGTIVETVS